MKNQHWRTTGPHPQRTLLFSHYSFCTPLVFSTAEMFVRTDRCRNHTGRSWEKLCICTEFLFLASLSWYDIFLWQYTGVSIRANILLYCSFVIRIITNLQLVSQITFRYSKSTCSSGGILEQGFCSYFVVAVCLLTCLLGCGFDWWRNCPAPTSVAWFFPSLTCSLFLCFVM